MANKTGFPWLTRAQAALLTGLGNRQFDEVIKPRIKKEGRKGVGTGLRYDATAVAAALVEYRIDQIPKIAPPSDDPLLTGTDSPNLERYRGAKAGQEEIKLAEMRGQYVAIENIEPAMAMFASLVRGAGDELQRQFGPDASGILNQKIDEAAEELDRFFENVRSRSTDHDPGGSEADPTHIDTLQDGESQVDAGVRRDGDHSPERPGEEFQVPGESEPVRQTLV